MSEATSPPNPPIGSGGEDARPKRSGDTDCMEPHSFFVRVASGGAGAVPVTQGHELGGRC